MVLIKTKIKNYGFSQALSTFHFIDFFVGFGRGSLFWPKRKAWFAAIPAT